MLHNIHTFERKKMKVSLRGFACFLVFSIGAVWGLGLLSQQYQVFLEIHDIVLSVSVIVAFIWIMRLATMREDFSIQIAETTTELVVLFSKIDQRRISRYYEIEEYRDVLIISDGIATIKLENEKALYEFICGARLEKRSGDS